MKSRLKQIRKELGLTQGGLADILGCSKNNISMIETGKSTLTERNKRWLVQSLNINPEWLDGGKGEMLLPSAGASPKGSETGAAAKKTRADGAGLAGRCGGVPVYDIREAELRSLLENAADFKPSGYIDMPRLPECDGAVYVVGEAMEPILRSGDLVLYSRLAGTSEIFWGEMYLVSVETSAGEYVAVRYLLKSKNRGKAVLAGENPCFAGTEIELSKIRAIAFVKAIFRMNSAR